MFVQIHPIIFPGKASSLQTRTNY